MQWQSRDGHFKVVEDAVTNVRLGPKASHRNPAGVPHAVPEASLRPQPRFSMVQASNIEFPPPLRRLTVVEEVVVAPHPGSGLPPGSIVPASWSTTRTLDASALKMQARAYRQW